MFFIDAISLKIIPQKTMKSRMPIAINLNECSNKIICEIDFDIGLYHEETIKLVWGKYFNLMTQIISNPNKFLKEYNILSPEEKSIKNNINIEFNF
jgi:hypothetical protein